MTMIKFSMSRQILKFTLVPTKQKRKRNQLSEMSAAADDLAFYLLFQYYLSHTETMEG